jgi:hypothetical protein
VTKHSKPFFSFLFAFFSQFTPICRDLYYDFITFNGAYRARRPTFWLYDCEARDHLEVANAGRRYAIAELAQSHRSTDPTVAAAVLGLDSRRRFTFGVSRSSGFPIRRTFPPPYSKSCFLSGRVDNGQLEELSGSAAAWSEGLGRLFSRLGAARTLFACEPQR